MKWKQLLRYERTYKSKDNKYNGHGTTTRKAGFKGKTFYMAGSTKKKSLFHLSLPLPLALHILFRDDVDIDAAAVAAAIASIH